MAWSDPGDFTSGQILTAAQMDAVREAMFFGQATFTNEAARDAAIPATGITLQEGMRAYLTAPTIPSASATTYDGDPSGVTTVYNGSVWVCTTEIGAYTSNEGSTTSTTYTATLTGSPGINPSVTLVTGTTALISMSCDVRINDAAQAAAVAFAVSGATTRAASDTDWLILNAPVPSETFTLSRTLVVTGLTAGTNTFTLNYRVSAQTGTYDRRSIVVKGIA